MRRHETLHALVRDAVEREPDKTALSGPDGTFTYGELDLLADRTAAHLRSLGVARGDRVAIHLDKSALSVILFQGVLRVGAVYVPIDYQLPLTSVMDILTGCSPTVVITSEGRAEQVGKHRDTDAGLQLSAVAPAVADDPYPWLLPYDGGERAADAPAGRDDPAYILYTSGSTGKPKGVCLSHENALSFIRWAAEVSDARARHVFANHAPFSFGISVYDLYVPFLVGGRLVIVPPLLSLSPRHLVDFVVQQQVTHWYSVPSAILLMMQTEDFVPRVGRHLECLMFAGEPFPKPQLNELRRAMPDVRMLNFYGATETNVSCYFPVDEEIPDELGSVPIGRAVCGDECWVEPLDDEGVSQGELVVRGPTVMLGYWGGTLDVDRAYRTGDIVRELESGDLEYLGRTDNIVKVKGYRVSLAEVEQTILTHPSVDQVAVVKVGEASGSRLIAYATVARGAAEPNLLEIKRLCSASLPQYKVVHDFRVVADLPLNPNSKVDRKLLAALAERSGEHAPIQA